ncbi:hypothetical protein [Komagataeibacter europaeus]|uniref:hypothetical protein n=1 Tax=Komagataeibacter europaeus TaxID=33995 RepID=UPI0012F9622D|nr:hypothetical protein [Komagataeibacter europaeus]GBQ42664.1 hypothetical protein AA18890_1624 [Komagataeibacter europaeus LMG 18890]
MTFIVDGNDWVFDEASITQIHEQIEALLEFVAIGLERHEETFIGDDFQTQPIVAGYTLWQLFEDGSPVSLSFEIRQELAAWLGKSPIYIDLPDWPNNADEIEISIDSGPPTDNVDVAWAHHLLRSKRPAACYSLTRRGPLPTQTASGCIAVYFVNTDADRLDFWRNTIRTEGDSLEELIKFAPHAYPCLYFSYGVLQEANNLDGGYSALRWKIQDTFSALNDHGVWIFTCPPPTVSPTEPTIENATGTPQKQLIRERFQNLTLEGEPENPNVRDNRVCREARELHLGSRILYCEWHIKLEKHRNRIHIHAPVPESNSQVVIAIISPHLPLP